MKRLLFSLMLAFAVSLMYPISTRADDDGKNKDRSRGTPYSNTEICVQSSTENGGFDPDTYALKPGVFLQHFAQSNRGVYFRNPDGTQTATFRNVTVDLRTPPPVRPVSVNEGTCTGNVQTQADGSRLFTYDCHASTVAGSGVGNTSVLTGGATFTLVDDEAQIGFAGKPDLPTIETLQVFLPTGAFLIELQRVCTYAEASGLVRSEQR